MALSPSVNEGTLYGKMWSADGDPVAEIGYSNNGEMGRRNCILGIDVVLTPI